MGINLPTYFLDDATVVIRTAEMPDPAVDFAGGMNLGGSNAPGIGIATGFVDPKLTDWTVLDQDSAARSPQQSQHLGGDGLEGGNQATEPVRVVQGADINDTMSFSVADTAAVADAIYDTGTGALNRTGATVAIGDRIWGPIPVA